MVTAVTEAVAAAVGHTVVFAVEKVIVVSAVGALGAKAAAEAQTVVTTRAEAAPAHQSVVAEVLFVSALVADGVTAGGTVAVIVPAAAVFVLDTLDVVVVVDAVSVVLVDQSALPALAVELLVPAAVSQAVAVTVAVVVAVFVAVAVAVAVAGVAVGLVGPPG